MSALGDVQRLFEQALELAPEERGRFLDEACADDPALRRRLEVMLAADAEPYLEPPATTIGVQHSDVPQRLGPFEILSKIGEGGMGVVYEARQETPRRIVALKVVRPGLASPEVLRRFHHESEVLGHLQHPGIAQVYAAGTVDGRPWFAMELIHGVPLDAWIVRQAPDLPQRLMMMAAICDAVHHAHERGIVHRDLKPANVLVDTAGQPKILDFGVARATNGDLAATMHTSTGQLVGTLAYMSPEQVGATGGTIDRRSDVYALGVVLYELLAGRLPYQIQGQPIVEALRVIRDDEPSRLSAVSHRFRGDLETIAAKALAKEPDRRYHTASDMASDIRRYLRDEPIVARPPSTWYQLRKFARRNRAIVGGIAAVIVVLLLGTVVATMFALREARQRALFEHEAYRSAIAAATAEIHLNDGGRAAAILDGTSARFRGWEWRYLRHIADRSLRSFPIDGDCTISISPDGTRIAAATSDELWVASVESGTIVRFPWKMARPWAGSVTFASDGRHLYVGDVDAGRTQAVAIDGGAVAWEVPYAGANALSFAPDGSLVFGAGGWGVAIDPANGRERRRWPIGAAATGIAYLADGQHAAYMTGSGMQIAELPSWKPVFSAAVRTYLSATGDRVIGERPGGAAEIRDPAGRVLVSSPVRIYDVHPLVRGLGLAPRPENGVALVDQVSGESDVTLLGHAAEIGDAHFAPDGKRFLTFAKDGDLRVWDTRTTPDPLVVHGSTSGAVSADGRFTAEAGWGSVRLWDARTGWPLWTRMISRRGLRGIAFDPGGGRIAVVGDDGVVFVLDRERDGEQRELAQLPAGAASIAWSSDGKQLAIGGLDGIARLLDASDGRELRTLGGADASAHIVLPLGNGETIAAGGRGPDALLLSWPTGGAAALGSGGVRLWDSSTGRLLRTLDDSKRTVRALAAGRQLLAAGFEDGGITVWDLDSGESRQTAGRAAPITGMLFDREGERLFVGRSANIEILESATLATLTVLSVPALKMQPGPFDMQSGAFSSDGALVAAGAAVALALFEIQPATELYDRRSLALRFDHRLDLHRRSAVDPDLIAALESSADLSEDERRAAVSYARALGNNPNSLNSEALGTVRRPDASRAEYELAHRQIQAALPFRPDDLSFLKTLSLAQLRLGYFRGALRTVERAEVLLLEQSQSPRAADLAVRAMAEQALGETSRARETLERLRVVMRSPAEAGEIESQAFLVEAERAVAK